MRLSDGEREILREIQQDCAPSADELFQERLADIWAEASPAERKLIARERGALDIRDKQSRPLTETESAIEGRIYEAQVAWDQAERDELARLAELQAGEPWPEDDVPF